MKTKLLFTGLLMFGLLSAADAQKKEKYNIYLDVEKNGKKVIIDTSFSNRADMEAYMEKMGFVTPEVPEIPELPPIPPIPPLPEIPELPEMPDMEKVIIRNNGAEMSEADKVKMRNDMEEAQIEMVKARKEMKEGQKEMEKARKEMKLDQKDLEKAQQELKKVRVQVDGATGESLYFYHDGEDAGDGKNKMIIIEMEGDGDDKGEMKYEYKIFKMPCDSVEYLKRKDEGNIRMIRKIQMDGSSEIIVDDDNATELTFERSPEPPVKTEVNEMLASTEPVNQARPPAPESYLLAASDFKLYPNPTEGKINVSFKLEQSGPVQVRLLDANGKVIVEEIVDVDGGYFSKEYSVENKSKGTYLLQLKQGDKWRHEKIIVK